MFECACVCFRNSEVWPKNKQRNGRNVNHQPTRMQVGVRINHCCHEPEMTSNALTFVAVHPQHFVKFLNCPEKVLAILSFITCTTSTIFDCFCHTNFLCIFWTFFQPYFTLYHPLGWVGYSIFSRSFAILACDHLATAFHMTKHPFQWHLQHDWNHHVFCPKHSMGGQRVWNHSVNCSFWRFLFCMAQYISATYLCRNHASTRLFTQIGIHTVFALQSRNVFALPSSTLVQLYFQQARVDDLKMPRKKLFTVFKCSLHTWLALDCAVCRPHGPHPTFHSVCI